MRGDDRCCWRSFFLKKGGEKIRKGAMMLGMGCEKREGALFLGGLWDRGRMGLSLGSE